MGKYQGKKDYRHGSEECTGVLLVNLGTPDAPTKSALRRYLKEFLWDPRVVEFPRPLWWLVLNLVILNIRPARSAKIYQKVWTDEGSPLLVISKQQTEALQSLLAGKFAGPVKTVLAMRYGNPSIRAGLEELRQAGARRVLVLPLYPQYSASTAASIFDAVSNELKTWRWIPETRFINEYAGDKAYIQACATRIKQHWAEHGRNDYLLFSFHGIPKRYLLNGDPYHCQCHKSARLIADVLELNENQWQLTFQSRFGREEWLQPYTDHTLKALPGKGTKSVDIFCPGFAADCLETLEEIAMENRGYFMEAGGEKFSYIPALNDMPEHIEALSALVMRHVQGWDEAERTWDEAEVKLQRSLSRERAVKMGAEK